MKKSKLIKSRLPTQPAINSFFKIAETQPSSQLTTSSSNDNYDNCRIIEPSTKRQCQSFINHESIQFPTQCSANTSEQSNLTTSTSSPSFFVPDTPENNKGNHCERLERVAKIEDETATRHRSIRSRSYLCSKTNFEVDSENTWKSSNAKKIQSGKRKRPANDNSQTVDLGYSVIERANTPSSSNTKNKQRIIIDRNAVLPCDRLLRQEVKLMKSISEVTNECNSVSNKSSTNENKTCLKSGLDNNTKSDPTSIKVELSSIKPKLTPFPIEGADKSPLPAIKPQLSSTEAYKKMRSMSRGAQILRNRQSPADIIVTNDTYCLDNTLNSTENSTIQCSHDTQDNCRLTDSKESQSVIRNAPYKWRKPQNVAADQLFSKIDKTIETHNANGKAKNARLMLDDTMLNGILSEIKPDICNSSPIKSTSKSTSINDITKKHTYISRKIEDTSENTHVMNDITLPVITAANTIMPRLVKQSVSKNNKEIKDKLFSKYNPISSVDESIAITPAMPPSTYTISKSNISIEDSETNCNIDPSLIETCDLSNSSIDLINESSLVETCHKSDPTTQLSNTDELRYCPVPATSSLSTKNDKENSIANTNEEENHDTQFSEEDSLIESLVFRDRVSATTIPSNSKKSNDVLPMFDSNVVSTMPQNINKDLYCNRFNRNKVLEVVDEGITVFLKLENQSGELSTARLSNQWTETDIRPGDRINILWSTAKNTTSSTGNAAPLPHYDVDAKDGAVVINPDHLISGTTLNGVMYCNRRSVLQYLFKKPSETNKSMFYGTFLHSLLQSLMPIAGACNVMAEIQSQTFKIISQTNTLHDMMFLGITEENVKEEIKKYTRQIISFLNTYMALKSTSKNLSPRNHKEVITKIIDIEHNISSPKYGFKGIVDVTVQTCLPCSRSTVTSRRCKPFELKTGRPSRSAEHIGQVTMYSMMLSAMEESDDCIDETKQTQSVVNGLLMYLAEGMPNEVKTTVQTQKGLILLRNSYARHLAPLVTYKASTPAISEDIRDSCDIEDIPNTLNDEFKCSRCPQLLNCSLFQKIEKSDLFNNPAHVMSQLGIESLSHLDQVHIDYFTRWFILCQLELAASSSVVNAQLALKQIWRQSSSLREEKGLCFAELEISSCKISTDNGYEIEFKRSNSSDMNCSFHNSISVLNNECLSLSSECRKHICYCNVTVLHIGLDSVVVNSSKNLANYPGRSLTYRLDKVDTFNTSSLCLKNVLQLMQNTTASKRLRDLIIDRKEQNNNIKLHKKHLNIVMPIIRELNKPQGIAVLKALHNSQYVLINGFPGTGKTSTIVALLRIYILLGKSVLLTSFTHSAVDNILEKLIKYDLPIVRLGKLSRIKSLIRQFTIEHQTKNFTSPQQLKEFYDSRKIFACTCLAAGSSLVLLSRVFDVCIIDECSQIVECASLAPLMAADKFILVGDDMQLPPVVKSEHATNLGMDVSLFERLKIGNKDNTQNLFLQYRMNSAIMRLSNCLTYDGAMKCSNEEVSTSTIHLNQQQLNKWNSLKNDLPNWIRKSLSHEHSEEVYFLNTEHLDKKQEDKEINEIECDIIFSITQLFIQKLDIQAKDIGVISLYNKQVKFIQNKFKSCNTKEIPEINTIDQFQGRDKSIVFVSFVKENISQSGGIINDKRRLNVALSRAKHKLLLIGNTQILNHYSTTKKLISDILHENQIISLPQDSLIYCKKIV